jgi:hypothetical protein
MHRTPVFLGSRGCDGLRGEVQRKPSGDCEVRQSEARNEHLERVGNHSVPVSPSAAGPKLIKYQSGVEQQCKH